MSISQDRPHVRSTMRSLSPALQALSFRFESLRERGGLRIKNASLYCLFDHHSPLLQSVPEPQQELTEAAFQTPPPADAGAIPMLRFEDVSLSDVERQQLSSSQNTTPGPSPARDGAQRLRLVPPSADPGLELFGVALLDDSQGPESARSPNSSSNGGGIFTAELYQARTRGSLLGEGARRRRSRDRAKRSAACLKCIVP
jgi:hypothetical protein